MDLIDDMIEVGSDVINLQDLINGVDNIDRQRILTCKNLDEVGNAVGRIKASLYERRGGVIAQCEFGAEARPENVRAVFEEWENV